jgi:hypothetical protein
MWIAGRNEVPPCRSLADVSAYEHKLRIARVDRLHLPAELDARSLAEWASAWVHVEKAGALAIHVPGDAFYRPIALVALAACVADRVERGLLTRFETDDPGSML